MKKTHLLFVVALAAVGLASCAGGKSGWTDDEKKVMKNMLDIEIPFAHGLTYSEDLSLEAVVFVGDKVSDAQVAEYGKKFEALNFVEEAIEYDSQGYPVKLVDVYNVADFSEEFEPIVYRINEQKEGYFPMFGEVVAVGKDADGKLLVAATEWASGFDCQFSSDYMGYNLQLVDLDVIYNQTVMGAVYVSSLDTDTEKDIENRIALFGTISAVNGDFVGIDDYQYMFPFSFGNLYSENFMSASDLYISGISTKEFNDYVNLLEGLGYTSVKEQEGVFELSLVSQPNKVEIEIVAAYMEEMFVGDDGEPLPGAYISFALTMLA